MAVLSGLACIYSLGNECNTRGAQLAGFDSSLIPGAVNVSSGSLDKLSKVWGDDLTSVVKSEHRALSEGFRSGKIKAAVVLGENPAIIPQWGNALEKNKKRAVF